MEVLIFVVVGLVALPFLAGLFMWLVEIFAGIVSWMWEMAIRVGLLDWYSLVFWRD